MSFPETITTGLKILEAFDDTRWIILASPMQAGKTSVYTYVAELMKENEKITDVFVISGISDNALRELTYERIAHIGKVYFLHDIAKKASGNLISALKEFSNSLIIIDESHIGANNGSELHDFLSTLGIGANGVIDDTLYPDNRKPYILSVSATPYAECASITLDNGSVKIVIHHQPGDVYFGLDKMNLIDILSIQDPRDQLTEALNSAADVMPKSYAIIRSLKKASFRTPDGKLIVIPYDDNKARELVEELGYPIIYCDMDNDPNIVMHLELEPDEFTVILIKKYARAGLTFPKKYVSMVWEIFNTADELALGLPGRMCGYENVSHVAVYCKLDTLLQHINWMSTDYDKLYIPSSGKNVRASSSGNAIPEYLRIKVFDTRDEAIAASSEFGYVTGPDFKIHVGNRTWTDAEMLDDNGLIKQYLPIGPKGTTQAWTLEFMEDFLLNQRPLMGAITHENGNKIVSVAKIAYRNLKDPGSIVYVLYHYDGPITTSSAEPTDNSMYIYGTLSIQPADSEIVQHIELPLDISEDDVLDIVLPVLYKPLSIIITPEGSNAQSIIDRIKRLTIETLEWKASISNDFPFLAPYFTERKSLNIPFFTPSSLKETMEFIIKIFAPTEDKAMTGREFDNHHIAPYLWNYRRSMAEYLSATSNKLNINKIKSGGTNFYYAT